MRNSLSVQQLRYLLLTILTSVGVIGCGTDPSFTSPDPTPVPTLIPLSRPVQHSNPSQDTQPIAALSTVDSAQAPATVVFSVKLAADSANLPATNPAIDPATAAFPGGDTTVFNTTPNAFSLPAPELERMQELFFFVGNSFFNQNWVTAPASTTARDGLGPLFNARSCAGCHFKDGRGRPPGFAEEIPTGFLVRLSVPGRGAHNEPLPDPIYGSQLQVGALQGIPAEGLVHIDYEEVLGAFADGTPYSLRKPIYTLQNLAYGEPDPNLMLSPRVANHMIGLGLLEAISEEHLLALADPDDLDDDGVSGRPNVVWDTVSQEMAIGRFGWKANQPNLIQQVASAFAGDMGIATHIFPEPNCTEAQVDCLNAPNGVPVEQKVGNSGPEIDEDDFHKVVLYASALAVPARRGISDPDVQWGERLFAEAGCTACHTPSHQTGTHPTIDALSNQTIYPYTDMLLHDMGDGLADGRPDFEASGSEWRTSPLWGIGLIETVNRHTYYLHDGRARSILEAILWHGGEAESSRDQVLEFSEEEREALVRFIKSL